MAKNKQAGKFSARDLLAKYQKEDIPQTNGTEVTREKDVDTFDYNEQVNEKILEYNKNILTLDPKYTSLKPLKKIIVRVFLKDMKRSAGGFLLPNVVMVKRQTNSGMGAVAGEIEAPPYSKKAVIVAVPAHYKDYMPVGTQIYLEEDVIEAHAVGTSQEALIRIKNAFVHPEAGLNQIPQTPDHEDYGYLAIPYEAISFIA